MRALWTGSLSFGLINIPIRLYSASVERALNFKLIDKNGNCPISYVKICRNNGKEVPYDHIVRGYEYRKGDYVVLDEKDFEKASPKKTDLIEIVQFSNTSQIDTKYFEKPYYIEPDKKAAKAYILLREALRESKKVAIARFIMREKEHMAAIKPDGDLLVLNQLRFEDEIRKPELEIPKETKYAKTELSMALALVKQLTKPFDAKKFKDNYTEKLEKIIDAKAKGRRIKITGKKAAPVDTNMKDLMKMLKKSLNKETKSGRVPSPYRQ